MVKLKNNGSPVYIGDVLCLGFGQVTPVDEKALEAYGKLKSGRARLESDLSIFDENAKAKKDAEERILLSKAKAEAEESLRIELRPIIEKEIVAELEKKHGAEIKALEKKIEALKKAAVKEPAPEKKPDTDEKESVEQFVFDPEIHHIEHRGAGKWFVMNLEDKVYGPLTEEEKAKFEAMIEA